MTLADAVKCKGERRTNLAPNALVSLAVEESVDIQTKARLEHNVVLSHVYEETDLHELPGDHGSYIDDISGECLNPKLVGST